MKPLSISIFTRTFGTLLRAASIQTLNASFSKGGIGTKKKQGKDPIGEDGF
jgi:hypothetical protein